MPNIFRGINLDPLAPGNTPYFLWILMGFLLVTSVLVVSFGRVGDIYGRVRMYTMGFAIFTVFSILLAVTWMEGPAGALWIIIMRVGQGVGGAFLFANSNAILTDAFPPNERGLALGINGVAAIGGSFLGLLLGGFLAPIEWRLVFLVSVPVGIFGTVWAYLKLHDNGAHEGEDRLARQLHLRHRSHRRADRNRVRAAALRRPRHGLDQSVRAFVYLRRTGGTRRVPRHREPGRGPHVPTEPLREPWFRDGQHRHPHAVARARWPAVHAHHLASGDLAAPARLLLRPDSVVGRYLHGAADRWFLHRGSRLGSLGRPPRRAQLRDAGPGPHGHQSHRSPDDPHQLHVPSLRGAAPARGPLHGALRRPELERRHELVAGESPRGRGSDAQHLPELGQRALDRLLLHHHHPGPRVVTAARPADRSHRARGAHAASGADLAHSRDRQPLLRVPRHQSDAAAARGARARPIGSPLVGAAGPRVLPQSDRETLRAGPAHGFSGRGGHVLSGRRVLVAARTRGPAPPALWARRGRGGIRRRRPSGHDRGRGRLARGLLEPAFDDYAD